MISTPSIGKTCQMKRKNDEAELKALEPRDTRSVASLRRRVSPPASKRRGADGWQKPSTAAVEAGEKHIEDHLAFFSQNLLEAARSTGPRVPRLSHAAWIELYKRNLNDQGHHFVVHQHDHPIAGMHYDLRLQCNATSSISFAIMYGLPGNPNSKRPNRNAIETRVHNLWNHLIETASHQTGTMLLWDTGEYEVLPDQTTDDTASNTDPEDDHGDDEDRRKIEPCLSNWFSMTESEKLRYAFRSRKIRLRLNGTRLPQGYVIRLRLTSHNSRSEQPERPKRQRRKAVPNASPNLSPALISKQLLTCSSESDHTSSEPSRTTPNLSPLSRQVTLPASREEEHAAVVSSVPSNGSDIKQHNRDEEDNIRVTNAYPGASNSIDSIHQRRWFLSLDRLASGFIKQSKLLDGTKHTEEVRWVPSSNEPAGFDAFTVLGRDHERSVVSGRLAKDILADDGVIGYVPRGRWRAITE